MNSLDRARIEKAVRGVKRGDVESYTVVVEAYQRRLRAAIAGLCPPSVDADEIAHLAFVKAYQNMDSYTADTDFYSWLCAFAQNLLRAEYKRIERELRNVRNYLDHVMVNAMEEDSIDAPSEKERIDALLNCMEDLPEHSRTIVDMRYSRGIALADIARAREKTVAAVKYQLFAIRKKLQDCVGRKLTRSDRQGYETV